MAWLDDLKYVIGSIFGDKIENICIPPTPKEKVVYIPKKPRIALDIDDSRDWSGIVIHHSATTDGAITNDWEGIKRYHTSWRIDGHIVTKETWYRRKALKDGTSFQKPWRAVGYHGGIERENDTLVFHWGRPLYMSGAHAAVSGVSNEYNKTHIGLCLVGNYDRLVPQKDLWDFSLGVVRSFMDAFNLEAEDVLGHREVYDKLNVPRQKTCPGKRFDMDQFRKNL